ncbi:MAG: hypothetical protein K8L99_29395 [Anaerolineae bacterium]|nr:hypothetical protein [Anaerolineae bacterium]MCZ2113585.1 hypothetical protein [Anaerolineae bacterium]GIK44857.1 MAG: hypothetical protein BroJett012_07600 [Betaproteobacteria bacterium]
MMRTEDIAKHIKESESGQISVDFNFTLLVPVSVGLDSESIKRLHENPDALRAMALENLGNYLANASDAELGELASNNKIVSIKDLNTNKILFEAKTPLHHWFAFYWLANGVGIFHCMAEDRQHALELCRAAHPGIEVYGAVPGNDQGSLVYETLSDQPACCPKCGGRTEFGEMPDDAQIHYCLRCDHGFVADPG